MAIILYLFGAIAVVVGGVWIWGAFSIPADLRAQMSQYGSLATLGTVMATLPGIGFVVTGVLFLAAGEALTKLGYIQRSSRATARMLEELVDRRNT